MEQLFNNLPQINDLIYVSPPLHRLSIMSVLMDVMLCLTNVLSPSHDLNDLYVCSVVKLWTLNVFAVGVSLVPELR